MDELVKLINLLEITRNQPQYGYASMGGNARLSNLAEHHYLVSMIGWQLADFGNAKGAKIDVGRVIKFSLLHDIGELFGGDIGMYYAKSNPQARKYAKQFEEENQRFISKFFTNQNEILALTKEILDSASDEAHISKIADYLEVTHYKLFANEFHTEKDLELVSPKIHEKIEKIQDEVAKRELHLFIDGWTKKMREYHSFLDATTDGLGV